MYLTAQSDSSKTNQCRLNTIIIGGSVAYTGAMTGLYSLWYKDHAVGSFHFFNDNHEWLQMDKIGHAKTAYTICDVSYIVFRWSKLSQRKALLASSLVSFGFLSTIELFDGVSAGWGFSTGDMLANLTGIGLYASQQVFWKEQRVNLKYSYHNTSFAVERPSVLGSNALERPLKDYNGQTYWLSVNPYSFAKSTVFPKWLNIAFGYGGEGMLTGTAGEEHLHTPPLPKYNRYRQYYIALDISTARIPTNNKTLKKIFFVLNFLKIPMPAIEFNKQNVHFYPIYM